jgi:hypothetical protein
MNNNPLNHSLQINLQSIRRKFGESPDIIVREFNLQKGRKSFKLAIVYYQRYDIANFLRLLRYISFFISLLGPSIYIAAITFHQEMIPTPLLITLAASREGVPFPTIIEALMMEFSFEILREAGVRMPRAIGQAVSIVGALVLGQAECDCSRRFI